MSLDGLYLDENSARYAKPEQCLRVFRGGLTWSSNDLPYVVELRNGGEVHAGLVYRTEGGEEVRMPVERAGTWEKTALVLAIAWQLRDLRTNERLTRVRDRRYREPPFVPPLGRADDVLGLMLRSTLSWRGTIDLEGWRTEVRFDRDMDATASCARARGIVARLRDGALDELKLRLAEDVYPEYEDYMRDLGERALPSAKALAKAMRVDTIALDEHDVKLWFGRVLGEHSIIGIVPDDCSDVTLGQS